MNTVGVKLGHYPMVHQTQVYREKKALIRYGKLSTSNYLSGRLFSLPIFNSMSATQADKVIKSLHDFAE